MTIPDLPLDALYDREDVEKVCRSLGFQYDENPDLWVDGGVIVKVGHSRHAVATVSIWNRPGWMQRWSHVPMGAPWIQLASEISRARAHVAKRG